MTQPTSTFLLGDATQTGLPDQSVDLVLGSPPYTDRRDYGIEGCLRRAREWVDWMIPVTKEALRVSRGPVVWVVNGCMKKDKGSPSIYQPAVEGLLWECFKQNICSEHPLIWRKGAAPNRNKKWWNNDWEYIVAFRHADERPIYFDHVAVSTPQKYMNGGVFRQRGVNGKRRFGKTTERNALATPYDILNITVGGGKMGDPLAHENEAPYPEALCEPLIRALTKPGDTVFDPFSGSGTTVAVALKLGRSGIGMDIRQSQIDLGWRRVAGIQLPLPETEQHAQIEHPRVVA